MTISIGFRSWIKKLTLIVRGVFMSLDVGPLVEPEPTLTAVASDVYKGVFSGLLSGWKCAVFPDSDVTAAALADVENATPLSRRKASMHFTPIISADRVKLVRFFADTRMYAQTFMLDSLLNIKQYKGEDGIYVVPAKRILHPTVNVIIYFYDLLPFLITRQRPMRQSAPERGTAVT